MKELLKFEKELGESGAKAEGTLVIENSLVKAQVAVSFPVAKIIEPATIAVDALIEKLKVAIPGNWEDGLLEQIKKEYKEELAKLISEV